MLFEEGLELVGFRVCFESGVDRVCCGLIVVRKSGSVVRVFGCVMGRSCFGWV